MILREHQLEGRRAFVNYIVKNLYKKRNCALRSNEIHVIRTCCTWCERESWEGTGEDEELVKVGWTRGHNEWKGNG